MSESWPITEWGSLVIRQDAPVDFRALHKSFYNWALEHNYIFNEKNFTEKTKSHGKEIEIVWSFERKVTDFIKFDISMAVWAHSMNPTKDGKMQGKIEIVFDSKMEMDWQNAWQQTPLHKFLRYLYIYYLKKQYFLNYAGKCWEETYSLHALVKSHLNQMSLF
jgi:hypothetical protein